jgi:thioesterase domain-containing protein
VLIVHPHGLVEDTIPPTIEAMAAERVDALLRLRPHGPYLLGGHCNGAFVAFEMARQLVGRGASVPAVVIVDSPAPRAADQPPADESAPAMTVDADGTLRIVEPRDRLSSAQIAYARAMNRYTGGPCATHLVILRSRKHAAPSVDLRWSRLARSCDRYLLPGNHVTLVTRHVRLLARVIGDALARACAKAAAR